MSIDSINNKMPQIAGIQGINKSVDLKPSEGSSKGGFGEVLQDALKEVNSLQNEADNQIEGLALKRDGVTPHTAMIALEKADIAFQLMSAIRGKIVRAYEEVVRTQV
jgi:flagellar hook-basal body complex protein FliE